MAAIHVTVPIVFWGRNPPVHDITCITRTEEDKGVASGTKSGQICIWDLYRRRNSTEFVLCPRLLLCGSHDPIISLAFVRSWSGDRDKVVSLNSIGHISLWDGKDGTCLKANVTLGAGGDKHCGIKCLARESLKETLIAVWGQYSFISILNSISLDLICVLKSSHNPNWISQICFIPNVDKKDALVAVTVDGTLKLWLLHSNIEMKEMSDLFEEKSKALGITQPLSLSSHAIHDCCIALVVCKDSWQVYDVSEGRTKQLMIRACEKNVGHWNNGSFLSYNMLMVWTETGNGYLYELDPQILPGVVSSVDTSSDVLSTAGCRLLAILTSNISPEYQSSLTYSYATFLSHRWHILGDSSGRLQVWHVDTVLRSLKNISNDSIPSIPCHFTGALSDSWKPPANPCSLIDALYLENSGLSPNITCSLFLDKFGRLICGVSNGELIVISATQAATKLLLQKRRFSRAWPQHYFLKGHTRRVTCLLHPSKYSSAYDSNYLLSGGADFSVRLWDLYKGKLVHTFAVHGGVVTDIVTCPPDINTRLSTCVCSIADDHSVAILSTSQQKCFLLASCHASPVLSVHWRLLEDFLLVNCTGGRLYVWQIETGTLDRCVEGETAKLILDNTPDLTSTSATGSSASPIQVKSLSVGDHNSLIQVLLFDPQYLINKLQKMERVESSKPRPTHYPNQVRAFRTYISARRNFSDQGQGPHRTPPTAQKFVGPYEPIQRDQAKALEKIGDAVARGQKPEVIQPEPLDMTINIARLLVSCLHAWNLDPSLDRECEETLGLVRPAKNISFGLLSKGGSLSLVLPGWGLTSESKLEIQTQSVTVSPGVVKEDIAILKHLVDSDKDISSLSIGTNSSLEKETSFNTAVALDTSGEDMNNGQDEAEMVNGDRINKEEEEEEEQPASELLYHVRWQLSRSLTTQHLLTVVSITNTLMNQSSGAHALAMSSGTRRVTTTSESTESENSSDEDEHTVRDNIIRAVWSRVAALHCVMLPERMATYFRPPHLPVLASRFMDRTQAIKEAAQALLQSELRRVGRSGRKELVNTWASKLMVPTAKNPSFDSRSKLNDDVDFGEFNPQATPTQQQQMTALVILGMIGAEFNTESRSTPQVSAKKKKGLRKKIEPSATLQDVEVLDPSIARQTAKTLQCVLLDKPANKHSLYSSIRCSAADLMGRGFHLWENYVDVSAVIMGLLDLAVHPHISTSSRTADEKTSKKSHMAKFMSEIAHRALNLMVLLRPPTIVNALAKEVSLYLGSQHSAPFPHSSLPPIQVGQSPPPNTPGIVTPSSVLLVAAKEEILELIRTILDKCSSQVSSQLLDVVDIVLFCLEQEELKRKNFNELFPSLTKLPNVSYSAKNRRLAVGARSGQVGVYDLKQRKTQMVNAHTHEVTVLCFSEDGKFLASYSYGDSMLRIWQIGSTLLGGIITSTPKCVHSWPAISNASPSAYSSYVRLEWPTSKIIVLYMPGGIEYRYSM